MSMGITTAHVTSARRRAGGRPAKHLRRFGLAAAASAAVVGGLAAPSNAAGPSAFVTSGNDVQYVGNGFTNRVLVSSDLPGTVLLEEPVSGITAGPGCTPLTSIKVRCAATTIGSVVDFVQLNLGAGSDEAKVQTRVRTTVLAGTGDDRYFGGSGNPTNVTFHGDDGQDAADYRFATSGVAVDLDGAADDGRLGVDHDNILSSVENLSGSDHADSLRGSASKNRITGGLGADALRGGAGEDEINASEARSDRSQADQADLSCGSGADSITLDAVDPNPAECETVRRVS